MIAKFIVNNVEPYIIIDSSGKLETLNETLSFATVTEKPYDEAGKSDDNDFAREVESD